MERRIGLCALWARSLIVGCLAFFLGVAGHISADGLLPGPLALTSLFLFSVMCSVPLLARPVKLPTMLVLLVGGQTGVHVVLTMTAGHRGDAPAPVTTGSAVPTPTAATLPTVDGRRVGSLLEAYQPTAGAGGGTGSSIGLPIGHLIHDLSAHAPMMAAHLAAAALVAVWLAHGEQLLWTLVALLGRTLVLALRVRVLVLGPHQPRLAQVDDVLAPLWSRWLSQPHSRRGPPLAA